MNPIALLSIVVCALGVAPPGARAWKVVTEGGFDSSGGFPNQYEQIARHPDGDVVIGGNFLRADATSYGVVAKLDPDTGRDRWRFALGSIPGADPYVQKTSDLAVDPAGGILVTTTSFGTRLVKLDPADGSLVWVTGAVAGAKLATDGAGNALLGGDRVAKHSGADGTMLWQTTPPPPPGLAGGWVVAIATDAGGNVIVVCSFQATTFPPFSYLTVFKLSSADGSVVWRYDDSDVYSSVPIGIATTASGDVVTFNESGVVRKHAAATGAVLWEHPAGVTVRAVAVDATGDAFFAASGNASGVITRLAGATGAPLWSTPLPSSYPAALTVDSTGDVTVTGVAVGDPPDPGVTIVAVAVTRLRGSDGDVVWANAVGGPLGNGSFFETGLDLAATGAGDAFVVGTLPDRRSSPYSNPNHAAIVLRTTDRSAGRMLRFVDYAGDPNRRRLQVAARDPSVLPGMRYTLADPAVSGASLTLTNPVSGETAVLALPATGWRATAQAARYRWKYVYVDDGSGPCRKASLAEGSFSARCGGAGIGFTLDEPSQGTLAAVLAVGAGGPRFCVAFGGTVTSDQSTALGQGRFTARNAPPPAACP